MTAHIVIKQGMNAKLALADITALVQHEFEIFHSTIQIEEMELFTEGRRPKDSNAKLVCFSHDDE